MTEHERNFKAGKELGTKEHDELMNGGRVTRPTYEFDRFNDCGCGKNVYVCTEYGLSRKVNIESELSFAAGYVAGWRTWVRAK